MSNSPRVGNALLLTIIILGGAAMIMALVAESSITKVSKIRQEDLQQRALDAAEAVASSRETALAHLAEAGDANAFVDMTDPQVVSNYGQQEINGVRVRWRVEPSLVPSIAPVAGKGWTYITNPSSDANATPVDPQQANDLTYLYRIAAEGVVLGADGDALARAQAVKYVSIDKTPLFRWVIFYAQKGPKGDLELSHGPGLRVMGPVHSNGAIYIGAATKVGVWDNGSGNTSTTLNTTTGSPLKGYVDAYATVLGPDQNDRPVRVLGVDGIFRLSKSLMFMGFNEFPITQVSGSDFTSGYSFTMTDPQGEWAGSTTHYRPPLSSGSTKEKLYNGNVINPNRVKETSGLVTQDGGTDSQRVINGVPLRGKGTNPNDSRDNDRTGYVWKTDSLKSTSPGFSGYARSKSNGGSIVEIDEKMRGRPFEAQKLAMPTYAAGEVTITTAGEPDPTGEQDDPTTYDVDESELHHRARPLFLATDGTSTTAILDTDRQIEIPEKFMMDAMGRPDVYMRRVVARVPLPPPAAASARADAFVGWRVVDAQGANIIDPVTGGGTAPATMGLIIRERPMPDYRLWASEAVPSGSSAYIPYTYGKQTYPFPQPFTAIDLVSDFSTRDYNKTPYQYTATALINNVDPRLVTYEGGGSFTVRTATALPPDFDRTFTTSTGESATYPASPGWYGGNWRFVHLRRPTSSCYLADQTGYRRTNFFPATGGVVNADTVEQSNLPLVITRETNQDATIGRDNASMRLEALFTVPESGIYKFKTFIDDAGAFYINETQILRRDSYTSNGVAWSESMSLTAGQQLRFVFDGYNGGGGSGLRLAYTINDGSEVKLPTGDLHPRKFADANKPDENVAFRLSKMNSIQCTISSMTGGSTAGGLRAAKAGLMITSAAAGVSPMMSGRNKYLALLYSPQRGVFVERRHEGAYVARPTGALFVGAGTGSSKGIVANSSVARSSTLSLDGTANDTPETTALALSGLTSIYNYEQGLLNTNEGSYGPIETGPLTVTRSVATKSARTPASTIQVKALNMDTDAKFAPSDVGKVLTTYTAATGTATAQTTMTISRWVSDSTVELRSKGTALEGTIAGPTPTPTPTSGSRATAVSVSTDAKGPVITVTYDDVNTFYTNSLTSSTGVVKNSTAIKAALESAYPGTTWTYRTKPSLSSTDWNVTPTVPDSWFVETPPATPETLSWTNILNKTFSVSRIGLPDKMEVNPFITRFGAWWNTTDSSPQAEYLPYCATKWDDAVAELMPNSGGIRPDWWTNVSKATINSNKTPLWTSASATFDDDIAIPAGLPITLKLARKDTTRFWRCLYRVGTDTDWSYVREDDGTPLEVDLDAFAPNYDSSVITNGYAGNPASGNFDVMMGLCAQSGDTSSILTTKFTDVSIQTSYPQQTPRRDSVDRDVIDGKDWDVGLGSGNPLTCYLASQYQVFFGPYDITEDFFSWNQDSATDRAANETWILNPREFWSQSKWWDGNEGRTLPKDSPSNEFPDGRVTNRELLARQSILDVNMAQVQAYLKARTLTAAISKPISGGTAPTPNLNPILSTVFAKIFYFARTNRYPVNPTPTAADLKTGYGLNPWNPLLPNATATTASVRLNTSTNLAVASMAPYSGISAYPFKDAEVPLAVRLFNADVFDWEYPATGVPQFKNSKASIVTPNQLLIKGNLNWKAGASATTPAWRAVNYKGDELTSKPVPIAIMADKLVFLSNNFNDNTYRTMGMKVTGSTTAGVTALATDVATVLRGSTAANTASLGTATDTYYWASILTHNTPTTKQSVKNLEAASIIGVMEYIENWKDKKFNFCGSIVVLDTRRRSQTYMLSEEKYYSWGPYGFAWPGGSTTTRNTWLSIWGMSSGDLRARDQMPIAIPACQVPPQRSLTFNTDLLTEDGTPPFTPFGVGAAGRGGWTKIIR